MELERYGGNSKNYHDVCLDSTWRLKVTRWNLHILKPVESLSADFRSFPIIYQICPKRLHDFCIWACFYSVVAPWAEYTQILSSWIGYLYGEFYRILCSLRYLFYFLRQYRRFSPDVCWKIDITLLNQTQHYVDILISISFWIWFYMLHWCCLFPYVLR